MDKNDLCFTSCHFVKIILVAKKVVNCNVYELYLRINYEGEVWFGLVLEQFF